jgi:hypothetical protein
VGLGVHPGRDRGSNRLLMRSGGVLNEYLVKRLLVVGGLLLGLDLAFYHVQLVSHDDPGGDSGNL